MKLNLRCAGYRLLTWALRRVTPPSSMAVDLAPELDYRHALNRGEHEVFYFLFCSPDGAITGGLRTLFSPTDVLEILALKHGASSWIYQKRTPWPLTPGVPEASGPNLALRCREAWAYWEGQFNGMMNNAEGAAEPIELGLTFEATNPPALYRLGNYYQAQQDGRLSGTFRTPARMWEGELICYRDHSWGRRGAGNIPGWMIIDVPEHMYLFIVGDTDFQPFSFGRFKNSEGQFVPVQEPQISRVGDGWQIVDLRAGMPLWHFRRLVPADVSYLGRAGEETAWGTPQTGDRFKDEIGPALFTAPTGERVVGFWDQATRL